MIRNEPTERQGPGMMGLGLLLAALVWSYQTTLAELVRNWRNDDNYSVGMLVPMVAVYFLWQERARWAAVGPRPAWVVGLLAFLLSQVIRGAGLKYLLESVERYSIVVAIGALVLLVWGWEMAWRQRWTLLFLLLMVPLPLAVHNRISEPLQALATSGAVFCLELVGVTVSREGFVIVLNGTVPIAVAEACSGLRMLTSFIVVSAFLAFLIQRPAWQKTILVASSIPIAILCNLVRLVVTAVLFLVTSSEIAERFFHDFAGLTMMPLAIVLLALELWLLRALVIADPPTDSNGDAPNSV